MDEMSEQ